MHSRSLILFIAVIAATSILTRARNLASSGDGKLWAVLVAGSHGYWNYRHQADVCHAYQLLKRGGLKDENIIVMMYDDIANNTQNPHPGKIFNRPGGPDVYEGVPKDYTGSNVNKNNLYAILSGDKSALVKTEGGEHSGKVLATGPNDHVFIYYSDHGGPGTLGMADSDFIYANELIDVLKKKHEVKDYKSILFYLEACESGSIFQGLLPDNWDIYAVTAANSEESSWATYCPGSGAPSEFETCLGDLFSVAWLEDTENHNRLKETLSKQYEVVKERTKGDSGGR